jgi:hypothetical protein
MHSGLLAILGPCPATAAVMTSPGTSLDIAAYAVGMMKPGLSRGSAILLVFGGTQILRATIALARAAGHVLSGSIAPGRTSSGQRSELRLIGSVSVRRRALRPLGRFLPSLPVIAVRVIIHPLNGRPSLADLDRLTACHTVSRRLGRRAFFCRHASTLTLTRPAVNPARHLRRADLMPARKRPATKLREETATSSTPATRCAASCAACRFAQLETVPVSVTTPSSTSRPTSVGPTWGPRELVQDVLMDLDRSS